MNNIKKNIKVKASTPCYANGSEPYYNSKQKKETLDMRALGRLVADYGHEIACGGEWSGEITEGNGNSVGFWKIKGR